LPSSLRGKDIERIPTTRKVVALTFDAGANADGLTSILTTLDAKNVPATFFLTGHFADAYPSQSRRIAGAGHRLGNHTVNHPHLPALSDAQIRAQVLDAERTIRTTTGTSPKPLFRFPYGDRNTHTIGLVNDAGYACIRWTVDTLGWKGTDPGGQTAGTVTQRVVSAATPGEIVLMHVGSNPDDHTTLDADALPAVIDALRAKGYSFVTLDALLGT
jgi:peptidoglycan/xylan/chitin deacetylase (PgdA/CDA1 family)